MMGRVSPADNVPRLSPPSIRRVEPEPPPPGWARRATALGRCPVTLDIPQSPPLRSTAVVVDVHCPAEPAIFASDFGRLEPRTGLPLLVLRDRGRR